MTTTTGYESTTVEAIARLLADQGLTVEPQEGHGLQTPGLTVWISMYSSIQIFREIRRPPPTGPPSWWRSTTATDSPKACDWTTPATPPRWPKSPRCSPAHSTPAGSSAVRGGD
ncbi:hypothetical protein SAMN05428942_7275 [Streptomyces sp. 2112.2]|nr:hypothetical protein SAMN05428942_7275 [Streptomyces sp. 2112.2]